jgi:hypothetical protein
MRVCILAHHLLEQVIGVQSQLWDIFSSDFSLNPRNFLVLGDHVLCVEDSKELGQPLGHFLVLLNLFTDILHCQAAHYYFINFLTFRDYDSS